MAFIILNCPLRIRNANVDVETEGEQRPRDHLILFNDQSYLAFSKIFWSCQCENG
jgi:hypothetical protein